LGFPRFTTVGRGFNPPVAPSRINPALPVKSVPAAHPCHRPHPVGSTAVSTVSLVVAQPCCARIHLNHQVTKTPREPWDSGLHWAFELPPIYTVGRGFNPPVAPRRINPALPAVSVARPPGPGGTHRTGRQFLCQRIMAGTAARPTRAPAGVRNPGYRSCVARRDRGSRPVEFLCVLCVLKGCYFLVCLAPWWLTPHLLMPAGKPAPKPKEAKPYSPGITPAWIASFRLPVRLGRPSPTELD
jgi:hypothetical protein